MAKACTYLPIRVDHEVALPIEVVYLLALLTFSIERIQIYER